ncbi:MAG: 5'/3'-nucleotidase SurE [Erysipelotrichaceae bacterium]|nr:5'/3'-nucleotidase SurE [Erysipelotrichaceae bacterium]MDP3305669.1 5'/3'-nucleotidase SurE [Erysipelotrichaceae bacterium]
MKKPLILICNDDGIYSFGLRAVIESVIDLGELLIVAPISQQTSMGRSFPKGIDVGIIEKVALCINETEIIAYAVHGSPALAVSHGVLELCERKPDLCISGINYGENLGLSITCSGTVGAAFEADSHGIPTIAVSRQVDLNLQHSDNFVELDWTACKHITRHVAKRVLEVGFPEGVSILNINVPEGATPSTEVRFTKQSRHNYSIFIKPEPRDFDKSFRLKSQIDLNIDDVNRDSDIFAIVCDKVISITPLTWNLSLNIETNLKGSLYEK